MTADINANSHSGEHVDIHGTFVVEWRDGLGWFYVDNETEDGPFDTSLEAYEAASHYGD